MLRLIQRRIEEIYAVSSGLNVEDFLIDRETLAALGTGERSTQGVGEMLLVLEEEGTLYVNLFIDGQILERLATGGGTSATTERLNDICMTTEGVSHFVYVLWRAAAHQPVTQLELELQAEVDKFFALLEEPGAAERLEARLFEEYSLHEGLDAATRERYLLANQLAHRYVRYLRSEYIEPRRPHALTRELRRFYRMGQQQKLRHIAGCAA